MADGRMTVGDRPVGRVEEPTDFTALALPTRFLGYTDALLDFSADFDLFFGEARRLPGRSASVNAANTLVDTVEVVVKPIR